MNWAIGTTRSVTWSHNLGTSEAVNIDESLDGGSTWTSVATDVVNSAVATGTYTWLVPGPASATARIRVTWSANAAVTDTSNVDFAVGAPDRHGDVAEHERLVDDRVRAQPHVEPQPRRGPGGRDRPQPRRRRHVQPRHDVHDDVGDDQGRYSWIVTGPATTQARVRVTWTQDAAVTDASNVNFRIQ